MSWFAAPLVTEADWAGLWPMLAVRMVPYPEVLVDSPDGKGRLDFRCDHRLTYFRHAAAGVLRLAFPGASAELRGGWRGLADRLDGVMPGEPFDWPDYQNETDLWCRNGCNQEFAGVHVMSFAVAHLHWCTPSGLSIVMDTVAEAGGVPVRSGREGDPLTPAARTHLGALSRAVGEAIGYPWRPPVRGEWRTSTVAALARGIWADHATDRLPILADALQDAGCESPGLLGHLRGPGPHPRTCWALTDVLLPAPPGVRL